MIVDIHAHFIPETMLAALASGRDSFANVEVLHQDDSYKLSFAGNAPTRPVSPKLRDCEMRRSWLDENGINIQVAGGWLDSFGYELPVDEGLAWSRYLSDHLLTAAGETDFIAPLGTVPLQDGEKAAVLLSELLSAGHRGVMIGTQPHGASGNLDDPSLDPFWAAANDLQAVIYIHPMFGCGDVRLNDFAMINAVGRGLDTTTAVARLLFAGHFLKYPKMKVVLSHGGGGLPYMLGRLIRNAAIHDGDYADPKAGMDQLYFDSVLFDPDALMFLSQKVGAGKIMMGSDYPFPIGDMAPTDVVKDADFDTADIAAILGGTAERLFKLENGCCGQRV
jgi:aminocarboxymuconate-semialdehyde decarboxylase